MTCRKEGEFYIIYRECLSVLLSGNLDLPQTVLYNGNIGVVRDILFMAPAGMISMAMSNYGFVDRFPRIQINTCRFAVDTFIIKTKQGFFLFFERHKFKLGFFEQDICGIRK